MGKPLGACLAMAALIITSSALVKAIPSNTIAVTPLPDPIPTVQTTPAMQQWLDRLKEHEGCPPEGIIDSNGLRSYGPYCFQAATFAMFKRQFAPTSSAELPDPDFQRWLTYQIVAHVPGGWQNWANSVKKIGKPPITASSTSDAS